MTRFALLLCVVVMAAAAPEGWVRHEIAAGFQNQTAVAADFTGDGLPDVITGDITAGAERVLLLKAPDWRQTVLHRGVRTIHGAALDVDEDGDVDFVGARYHPGQIYWLENPSWKAHIVDEEVDGVHGLLLADVDRDGRLDLIASSGQPQGKLPDSLVWYTVRKGVWTRHVFADRDAPGLTHYLAFGDLNGDGRGDIACAAKESPGGNWFAWWEQPADASKPWRRHWIAQGQYAATNVVIADFNGDGKPDVAGSRGHGVGLSWFEAPGWREHPIDREWRGIHALAAGDLDRDGDADLAGVAKDSRIAFWLENAGHGVFRKHVLHTDQSSYDARLADMDGDGDPDLIVAGFESRNVVWWENRLR